MQNVPKTVRERLGAITPLGDHPDADVLTAFGERVLPDREHAVVLNHLASCRDCRDVVSFALPATEAAQPVISPARGWLTWPALRWGFAAAGFIVIVSFGVFQYQRQTDRQSTVAKVAEPRAENLASQPQAQAPAPVASPEPKRDESTRMPAKSLAQAGNGVPRPSAAERVAELKSSGPTLAAPAATQGDTFQRSNVGAIGGAIHTRQIAGGPNMPTQWQQQRPATSGRAVLATTSPTEKQQSPSAPSTLVSSDAQTVTVTAAAIPLASSENVITQAQSSQAAAQTADQSIASNESAQQLSDEDSKRVDKAKPATTLRADLSKSMPPRWAINAAGGLQRSFDQGSTWQDVNVTANLATDSALKSYATAEVVARAKEKDNAAVKKVPAVSTPVFRAVAVNGVDVWAGGSNGALYHSFDAGNHWTQILTVSASGVLTGDIVSVEFSDARHGRVRTSTVETWVTSDGGQTWQKQ